MKYLERKCLSSTHWCTTCIFYIHSFIYSSQQHYINTIIPFCWWGNWVSKQRNIAQGSIAGGGNPGFELMLFLTQNLWFVHYITIFSYKSWFTGLPWWRSGWESACQCKGHGFEPWSGKIPHATEHLGPWATTTEPAHLEPVLPNKRGRDSERPMHRDEEWPLLAATRGSPHTETKTQHSQK